SRCWRRDGRAPPRLRSLHLVCIPGARVGHDRRTALERPAVGDLAADERCVVAPAAVAAPGVARRRHRESLTGHHARCATLRLTATRRRLATRSATGLAPA